MATKPLPSQEALRQLLDYDPESGALRWKSRPVGMFRDSGKISARTRQQQWNKRWAGKPALTANSYGYRVGNVGGAGVFTAHRVIWKMVHNEEPVEIDHINGTRSDNRLTNLRSVTCRVNGKNKAIPSNNTTGVLGVSKNQSGKPWRVCLQNDGKQVHIGVFATLEEAAVARAKADASYGYHPNHGRKS